MGLLTVEGREIFTGAGIVKMNLVYKWKLREINVLGYSIENTHATEL